MGTDSCQRNQVCVNVIGSFKCETQGPDPAQNRCTAGFGYNQLTRECEGNSFLIFSYYERVKCMMVMS